MPESVQPIARVLPLTPVVDSLREIANDGMALIEILPNLLGVAVWIVISFALATRLFVWKEVVN